jgi:hypothetical protein
MANAGTGIRKASRDSPCLLPVLGIRIRILMFLGLQDPDPLVRGADPDPSLF